MKPQEMEAIPQAFESKMRELQLRIMEDIVRRLRKNAGEVTAATEWQMKRAYELGVSKQALRQLLEQVAEELETQVDEVYDSKLANVYSADRQRYKAVGKPFIEYAENKELQQLISAVKAQTKDGFRNITQSMGFALPSGEGGKIEFHPLADYYQQTLDGAVMDIASGAFDYNTVLKRITNEMTNSGVRTVAYASGHTDRIEVAARRAVMTGFHQVVAKKAEQDMAALDTNYVEVTWHHGARPTHQVWQGKVYFWDRGFEDSLAEPPETLDNSGKSGIIIKEESPRKSKTGSFEVDWEKVQSPEYSEKFKKLSDNPTVSEAIETRAIWALNNRSGTQTEEIYAVSLKSGKEIARITNQNHESGVERSHSFDKKLSDADRSGDEILLIHNHPRGLPPSISDINELLKHKNVSGITVGHDGSVYRYTRPSSEISETDWNVELRHFNKFSESSSMEKALGMLMKKYGFEFEIL